MALEIGSRISPRSNKVAIGFDSRTAAAFKATGLAGGYDKSALGYGAWLEMLSCGAIEIPSSLNFGVVGDTTADFIARLPAAIAACKAGNASAVVLLGPTNDRTKNPAIDAPTSIANLTYIRDQFLSAGIMVVFVAELPRGSATYTAARLTAAKMLEHMVVCAWMRTQANVPGCYVADPYRMFIDPASQIGDALDAWFYDGLHLYENGAYQLAASIWGVMKNDFRNPSVLLPSSNADIYDAANNVNGSITINPLLGGTGGSLPTGTGTMAANWQSQSAGNLPTGVTATFTAAVACADGVNSQRVVFGGNAPASGNLSYQPILQNVNIGTNGLVVGNTYEMFVDAEIDGDTAGIAGIQFVANIDQSTNARYMLLNEKSKFPVGKNVGRIAGKSDPFTLSAGTTLRIYALINFIASATVGGTIRLRGLGARLKP